ncbi:DUF2975 domain-containing protein [Ancylomarina longa]|uniref:DUF2975 domain-containing protein n=1 Tax=Ancylomarina longa TaxID=2487017 RepID=A0A434AXW1_9BACT|nr:DUF2975 domain-containing protein [Ancylomarina longa]RUT79354.1 DUF2975 domain-containing protein [Ancylomarina longa]
MGGDHFNGILNFVVIPDVYKSNDIAYGIWVLIDNIIIRGLSVLGIKQLKDIFNSLKEDSRRENYFCIENYKRIRMVGFIMLGLAIYQFLVSLIFSLFLISDFQVLNQTVNVNPDFKILARVIRSLMIFVIAEVYKVGLNMKEDAELTI